MKNLAYKNKVITTPMLSEIKSPSINIFLIFVFLIISLAILIVSGISKMTTEMPFFTISIKQVPGRLLG